MKLRVWISASGYIDVDPKNDEVRQLVATNESLDIEDIMKLCPEVTYDELVNAVEWEVDDVT